MLVLPCTEMLAGNLLSGQFTQHASRRPHHQATRRDLQPRFDEGHRAHDGVLSYPRTVHDHRIHSDHRVAADITSVQHGGMSDMPVFVDDGVLLRDTVNDASVLNIRPAFHLDAAEVATQGSKRPHINAGTDNDVADQDGARMNESSRIHDGCNAVDGIDLQHACLLYLCPAVI